MVEAGPPKGSDQFSRLMAQLDVLKSGAFEELTKALPPEKRKQIADALLEALSRATAVIVSGWKSTLAMIALRSLVVVAIKDFAASTYWSPSFLLWLRLSAAVSTSLLPL